MARNIKKSRRAATVAAGALALLVGGLGSAQATPGYSVNLPDGTVVELSGPMSTYSLDELAALGIGPGQHGVVEATVEAVPTPRLQPMSASGCNGAVCITLTGTGLSLKSWTTKLTAPAASQTWAEFWKNGILVAQSGSVWANAGDIKKSTYAGSLLFSDNDTVCNAWGGFNGRPCETLHP